MLKLAKLIDFTTGLVDVAQGDDEAYFKNNGFTWVDVEQSDINGNWYLAELCPYLTEDEKAKKEHERVMMLSLTRGDVFRGLLQSRGVTRAQIRTMIETNENLSELEREMALIDFDEALNFYRGNSLINTIGEALDITSKQLDEFFETGDYTKLGGEE